MADVSYKGVSNKEPKVSVSGIPQSQYNASPPSDTPNGGGGIVGNIKQHWPVYTVVLAIATIVVMIWVSSKNSSSSAGTATGSATTGTYPDQVYGSQLEADYQQMMSLQNQTNALLQNLNSGPSTTPTTSNGPTPIVLPTSKYPGGSWFSNWSNLSPQILGGNPNPEYNMGYDGMLYVANSSSGNNNTIQKLAAIFHWTPQQVYNYGNNAQIFANEGITSGQWTKVIKPNTVIAH